MRCGACIVVMGTIRNFSSQRCALFCDVVDEASWTLGAHHRLSVLSLTLCYFCAWKLITSLCGLLSRVWDTEMVIQNLI